MRDIVFAIDPGPVQSAFVVWNGIKVLDRGLVPNQKMIDILSMHYTQVDHLAIEMIASYGMAVGADVFMTCVWIGRFMQTWVQHNMTSVRLIYRREVKVHLCESMRAKDTNIKQALIDRFASGYGNHGKGTKQKPSIFYGFKKDIWAAMSVGVYAWDTRLKWMKEQKKK